MDGWTDISYIFPVFGSGANTVSVTNAGDGFSIYNYGLGIYDGYVSGAFLSGSATYAGSFASLGLNLGTYRLTLPSDTVTLNIGSQVPVPATLALVVLGLGLAGLGILIRDADRFRRFE